MCVCVCVYILNHGLGVILKKENPNLENPTRPYLNRLCSKGCTFESLSSKIWKTLPYLTDTISKLYQPNSTHHIFW